MDNKNSQNKSPEDIAAREEEARRQIELVLQRGSPFNLEQRSEDLAEASRLFYAEVERGRRKDRRRKLGIAAAAGVLVLYGWGLWG
jgi:hypothetical protein